MRNITPPAPEGLHIAKDSSETETEIRLTSPEKIGSGSFCVTYSYFLERKGHPRTRVALKACSDKKEFNARERDLLMNLNHPNVIKMFYYFTVGQMTYLILELMDPQDLFELIQKYHNPSRGGLGIYTELYAFQLFRGLAYCHMKGIIHRDLKPENLFVRHAFGQLKIGDFGISISCCTNNSALQPYVGTRDFRAPEMLLGSKTYDSKADVWSGLIVLTEMVLDHPIFGDCANSIEVLSGVSEYLGSPTQEDYLAMGAKTRFASEIEPSKRLASYFAYGPARHDYQNLLALLKEGLVYSPIRRLSAWDVLAHPYFDKLKDLETLPNNRPLPPPLFVFSDEEKADMSFAANAKFLNDDEKIQK